MNYHEFLERKTDTASGSGFRPVWMHEGLYPFQSHLTDWAIRKGRAALFEDCGLGKTAQQLVFAENVVRHTNRPVLVLTPLAVTSQTVREASKFGVTAEFSAGGACDKATIYVTNYEKLHHFDPASFAGVVCDESGILKSFDGKTRADVTRFMRTIQYRLLCTATPSPNDYIELGTSSEALGELGFMDMLARFFKNNRNNCATNMIQGSQPQWRFKGHAERPFWRWVASWARCIRTPSDLGFDDGAFILPGLEERTHTVEAARPRDGMLFSVPAIGLQEEREERRRTINERCAMAAELVNHTGQPAVCWAHLNDEADLLEKMIPDAIQVSGKDSDEAKVEKFDAFSSGQARVLVTKPVIGAWGLNWQHCAHTTMFTGHSFEQYYQAVRRFYRFGQTKTVVVDHVGSDGESRIISNLKRKSSQAERLFNEVVAHMRDELTINRHRQFTKEQEVPSWL